MLNRFTYSAACLVGLLAMGCSKETTSSSNIKTGGIAALIDVYADDDDTATVHVKLVVGGSDSNTYVDLTGGDRLIATADDGDPVELEAVDPGIYEAEFSGVGEDTEFAVTLEREDDDTASANSGKLPAPFTLDEPASDLSRKDDDLEVTWTPESSDDLHVAFDGDCIFDNDHDISDTGSYTVEAGSLDSTGGDKPETCDIKVTLDRTREGSADSKFDRESWFKLHQRRAAKFTSNP